MRTRERVPMDRTLSSAGPTRAICNPTRPCTTRTLTLMIGYPDRSARIPERSGAGAGRRKPAHGTPEQNTPRFVLPDR